MDKDAILAWAKEKMGHTDETPMEPGYRLHHGQRVAALALALAEQMNLAVDRDILYVGALLHDVGKAGGQPGKDHGERGAHIIRNEIPHLFCGNELDRVCDIVANHYVRPNHPHHEGRILPKFADEVLLVRDADILDHCGSLGIWITMHWTAYKRRSPDDLIQQYEQDLGNLEQLIRPLNYELSKVELRARCRLEQDFYSLLTTEHAGNLTCLLKCLTTRSEGSERDQRAQPSAANQ